MELFRARLRRVGNSLSVLVPKRVLEGMDVGEGDEIEVGLYLLPDERERRLDALIGSVPGLGPFKRDRKDRY